ncbi:MAG TPA: 50S ribosomal protein L25/general stress protein Ctc [Halanaerobiales bacterium]|nr:50S ribosomal protein L25/general stress protein Ctc [Halanaerobiales bacterium]
MHRYSIDVEKREKTGKGVARKLRKEGLIPGVVYGRNREPQALTVDPDDLKGKLYSNAIIDLSIDGEEETVMIKDFQKDVIKEDIIHVDFQHIAMDETISITVPIKLVGDAPGVREGGVLQQLMREVDIEVLPTDIPDEVELDINELTLSDSLEVSDLEVPEEVTILNSPEDVIVTIVAPSEEIEEEEEEELEEEFIEPEVIGEEEEEEGEEGEEEEENIEDKDYYTQ